MAEMFLAFRDRVLRDEWAVPSVTPLPGQNQSTPP